MADGPDKGAEVIEPKVNPPTGSRWEDIPKTDSSFEPYFKDFQKIFKTGRHFSLFNTQINAGKFLFRNGQGEAKHVIWEFNNDQGYEKWWDDVRTTPEITQKVSQELLDLLENANNFYPWGSKTRKGFIVVGHVGFGMNPGIGEGININYEEIKHLINAHRNGDQQKIDEEKIHLAAQMVHELTHLEHDLRGDDGLSFGAGPEEIGPHIPQFLFDPKNNHIFNRQLKRTLDELKSKRDLGEPKKSHGYDWAQYTALLVTADKLAEQHSEIKKALEEDSDPSKIEGLKKVIDLAGLISEDHRKDISTQLMELTNRQIIERGKVVEDKLGITAKLI